MKKGQFFKTETIGDFLKHVGISFGILFFVAILYFYIYLPNATNHGDHVTVPDLLGMPSEQLDSFLAAANLRFEISDSSFSDDFGPLEVIRQFPHAGSVVKPKLQSRTSKGCIVRLLSRIWPGRNGEPSSINSSSISARRASGDADVPHRHTTIC